MCDGKHRAEFRSVISSDFVLTHRSITSCCVPRLRSRFSRQEVSNSASSHPLRVLIIFKFLFRWRPTSSTSLREAGGKKILDGERRQVRWRVAPMGIGCLGQPFSASRPDSTIFGQIWPYLAKLAS